MNAKKARTDEEKIKDEAPGQVVGDAVPGQSLLHVLHPVSHQSHYRHYRLHRPYTARRRCHTERGG